MREMEKQGEKVGRAEWKTECYRQSHQMFLLSEGMSKLRGRDKKNEKRKSNDEKREKKIFPQCARTFMV